MRKIKYLINLKTKKNFISQFFVKQAQLLKDIFSLLQIQIVNNCIIVLYKIETLYYYYR